jgi:hypothetical protein
MSNIDIFFNSDTHTYTDSAGNTYTSVTTVIGKYGEKFDTYKMAKLCEEAGKRGNPKYAGKTAKQLIVEWDRITKHAISVGNAKHDYLETNIKKSNNYKIFERGLTSGRLYTIADILNNPNHGLVDLGYFIKLGVKDRYPSIFEFIRLCTEKGYRMYPEIGTFSSKYLVSGLIDLLLVKGDTFVIADWKTNRDPLTYESGYFEKDESGFVTSNFIRTNKYFSYPLQSTPYSKGYIYSLQLSTYAALTEMFGLKHLKSILFHIRHANEKGIEEVNIHEMEVLKQDALNMMEHHASKLSIKKQKMLFKL